MRFFENIQKGNSKTLLQAVVLVLLLIIIAYFSVNQTAAMIIFCLLAVVVVIPILKNPTNGVLFCAFLLPFEYTPRLDLFGITIRLSQIAVLATLLSFIIHRVKIRLNKALLLFNLCFGFVVCLGLFKTPDLARSLQILVYIIFTCFLFPTLVISSIKTKEQLMHVLKVYVFAAVVTVGFGLYQFAAAFVVTNPGIIGLKNSYSLKEYIGLPRMQSVSTEPLYYANFLIAPIFLCMARLKKEKLYPWFLGVLFLGLALTLSRGAFLGMALSLLILVGWFLYKASIAKMFKIQRFGFILALISVFVVAGVVFNGKVASFLQDLGSFRVRQSNYEQAYKMFEDNMLLGVGLGGYGVNAVKQTDLTSGEVGYPIVNNQYLELLAENGILGLAAFMLFIFYVFYKGVEYCTEFLRKSKKTLAFLLLALLAILVQYASFSTLYIMNIWFVIALILTFNTLNKLDYKNDYAK